MNCKPGDLAIVVSSSHPISDSHIGKVVKLGLRTVRDHLGTPCWLLAEPFHDAYGRCIGIADKHLRPISGLPDTEQTDERQPAKDAA